MLVSIRLAVARSTRSDRSCLSRGSNDRENDLPAHVSMFYLLQGKSGLLERIDVVDDHLELSGIDEARNAPQQLSARLPGEEGGVNTLLGQPGRLSSHDGREDPATGPQDLADVLKARRISGGHIQHGIDSSWIERVDGADQVALGKVERPFRTQTGDVVRNLWARGRQHAGAAQARHLNGVRADATGGSHNQDRLTGTDLQRVQASERDLRRHG